MCSPDLLRWYLTWLSIPGYLTWLSIPGVIRETPDGLTHVYFVNGRPDAIDVLLKGKRLQ